MKLEGFNSWENHEENCFAYLDEVWDALPAEQKRTIEETVDFLMSEHGTICSKYDFIRSQP